MTTPHPDQEALAELADAADSATDSAAESAATDQPAESAATAEVRAHVADCAQCTADLAALREVQATLRALPPIPMPADVAARLEAALLAAAAPTVGTADVVPFARPASDQLRRTRTREFPLGAAAALVLVLAIGAVAIGLSQNSGARKSTPSVAAAASTSAAASSPSTTVVESGTNYTAADIRSQVVDVVSGAAPDAANQFPALRAAAGSSPAFAAAPSPAAAASASSAPSASASALTDTSSAAAAAGTAGPLSVRTAPGGPLADPAALARCIQTLVQKPEQPVLVDYATFNGVPSTIIVLPDPDVAGKLDIYVEADTAECAISFVTFLPPPASPAS